MLTNYIVIFLRIMFTDVSTKYEQKELLSPKKCCFLFFETLSRWTRILFTCTIVWNQFGAVRDWSTRKKGVDHPPPSPPSSSLSPRRRNRCVKVFEQLCGEPRHYGGVVPEYYAIYNRGWISSILRIFISRDFWRYAVAIFRNFGCVGSFVCANISIWRIISNYFGGWTFCGRGNSKWFRSI